MNLKEYTLIKISLISFCTIFLVIYFIEVSNTNDPTQINKITLNKINQNVKIEGEIIFQNLIDRTLFLKIKDKTGIIDAIVFNTNKTLNKSQKYCFSAKVIYYKEKTELIINSIKLQS